MKIFSILISRRCLIDTWIYSEYIPMHSVESFSCHDCVNRAPTARQKAPNHMSNKERVYLWGWHEWMVMTVYSKAEEDGAWQFYYSPFFFFFHASPHSVHSDAWKTRLLAQLISLGRTGAFFLTLLPYVTSPRVTSNRGLDTGPHHRATHRHTPGII